MKHKLFFATLGLTSALLVSASLQAADDDTKTSPSPKTSPSTSDQGAAGKDLGATTSGHSEKFTRASQLIHQPLKSTSGESLGQVNDLIVDPATGRIEFAVIAFQGGEQTGKLTAIPWTLVRASGEGPRQNLTASIDKTKLSTAQTFERTQWPSMSQESWAEQIYSHYGLQWQDRTSAGGKVPIGGTDTGVGVSPDRNKDPNSGTTPDNKGTKPQNPSDTSTSPSTKDNNSGLK